MAVIRYWNPKNETLPREELRALQLVKLKRLCEWAYAKSASTAGAGTRPVPSRPAALARRPAADPVHDARRMDGRAGGGAAVRSAAHRPADERDPLSHHLRHDRPHAAARARRHEGLGVDRRDVGLRPLGLRAAPGRRRPVRVLLRHVHRVLGRALRVREDRLPRALDRQRHDRIAGQEHRRHGRHHGLLDADLRAAACGRRRPRWASTSPATRRSTR